MADEPNLLEPWQTDLDGMKDTDPFGTKLHEGLEYFLWKMSLPLTPSYNINADLKYSVRMYFHDSRGGICFNPFLNNAKTDYGDFRRNFEFLKHSNRGLELNPDKAVQDGEGNQLLSQEGYCFDLTPFIQSITLPPIGTTAATDVSTQLGTMKVGAYSPYSSDGGREITFQMIDTEYSILDAIFYPWLKMIGNPKWYDDFDPGKQKHPPYPICNIEIATPCRRAPVPNSEGEIPEADPRFIDEKIGTKGFSYYVYEYIGCRPKDYDIPELTAESKSSLTRRLTMVCDLVLIDMERDGFIRTYENNELAESQVWQSTSSVSTQTYPDRDPPNADAPDNNPDAKPNTDDEIADTGKKIDTTEGETADQEGGGEPGQDEATSDPNPQKPNTDGDNPVTQAPSGDAPVGTDTPPPQPEPETTTITSPFLNGGNAVGAPTITAPVYKPDPARVSAIIANSPFLSNGRSGELDEFDFSDDVSGLFKARSATARDSDTAGKICTQIAWANALYYLATDTSKECVKGVNLKTYPADDVRDTARSSISQFFDTFTVKPLLELSTSQDKVFDIGDDLINAVEPQNRTTHHNFEYSMSGAKAAGGIIDEVQSKEGSSDPGNYGRVSNGWRVLSRISTSLPKLGTDPVESYFSLRSLETLAMCPNNSLSLTTESHVNVWPTGVSLNFIHNALVDTLGVGEKVLTDRYPFLFNYEYLVCGDEEDGGFSNIQKLSVLKHALEVEKEDEENRKITDDLKIEWFSIWEVIDDNLNHTGVYWCKLWLTDSDGNGRIYICKLDYRGAVIKHGVVQAELPDEWPLEVLNKVFIASKEGLNFCQDSGDFLYEGSGVWKIKKGGQTEADYHPASCMKRCIAYSFTTECLKDNDGNLIPTERTHYEEMPVDGDPEYTTAEFDPDTMLPSMYTVYVLDDMHVMVDELYYVIFPVTEYAVRKAITEWEGEIFPAKMGLCPKKYWSKDRLILKRHNNWDEEKSKQDCGAPYNLVHTTNSHTDMFDDYIPPRLSYVCQYRHQKTRMLACKEEQDKLRQLHSRFSVRADKTEEELAELQNKIKVITALPEVNKLLYYNTKLSEVSSAYNAFIVSELKQDAMLTELTGEARALSSEVALIGKAKLNRLVSRAEDKNLHKFTVGTVEKNLSDIRKKEKELAQQYAELLNERKELLAKLLQDTGKDYIDGHTVSECIDFCVECVYSYVLKNCYLELTRKFLTDTGDFYQHRVDRTNIMERLIVFFDKNLEELDKVIGSEGDELSPNGIGMDDLILFCDWKAWGDSDVPETQRERANQWAYDLRKTMKLPQLKANLARLIKKRQRITQEEKDKTELVYDPVYAVPGYMPENDAYIEQDAMDLTSRDAAPTPEEKRERMKTALRSMLSTYKEEAVESVVGTKQKKNRAYLKKVSEEYSGAMGSTSEGAPRSEERDLSYLAPVVSEYTDRMAVEGSEKDKVEDQGSAEFRYNEAVREVVSTYRTLDESFAKLTKEELLDSLLLVLSSDYLKSVNTELFDKMLDARMVIEKEKKIHDDYQALCNKELELLSNTKDKRKDLVSRIQRLVDKNKDLLARSQSSKSVDEDYQLFRLNVVNKMEMEDSLDKLDETIKDMLDHYENNSMKLLGAYENNLNAARDKYNELLKQLSEDIGFKDKILEMAGRLAEIR